ncbi:hypothetical protein [Trinickia dinghuensis]|uniref:Peptidase C39-like domain-containing protein n=1 Tax=Trinickia dinghuensis TaxID=2291023 RepID=A0A3D8JZU6_9BURK|nr:hypothetical protein [Trinickia dinghuensis]RDU98176.1 hypothetical protein DWV00_12625 [Trinickia dinghuensis]
MLIQQYHPALRLGPHLALAATGNPLFSRQGHWDGGSSLHCVAMALAMLGKLEDPVYSPYRVAGNEHVLWSHAWQHYLHGLTLSELASFISELDLDVKPILRVGAANEIVSFTALELRAGHPVIIGWRQRHPVKWHAALVVGIEGRQNNRSFAPHALLLLDPAGDAPGLAGCNARVDRHKGNQTRYQAPTETRVIKLAGAVSMR